MIKMKFCDMCGQELPPTCFTKSDVIDTKVHASHPWPSDHVRTRVSYDYFSGGGKQVDVCVECAVTMVRSLANRMERRNKRDLPKVKKLLQAGDLKQFPVELTAKPGY